MTNLVELYRKLRPLPNPPSFKQRPHPQRPDLQSPVPAPINSEVYPYCTPGVLRSAYRRSHLSAELEAYGPFDIGAFQEVAQFDDIWRKELEKHGKRAVYG